MVKAATLVKSRQWQPVDAELCRVSIPLLRAEMAVRRFYDERFHPKGFTRN